MVENNKGIKCIICSSDGDVIYIIIYDFINIEDVNVVTIIKGFFLLNKLYEAMRWFLYLRIRNILFFLENMIREEWK